MKQTPYKSYDELPLMLSVGQVATVLGISRAGAYELVKSAGFPSMNVGTRIIVPKDKFIDWVEKKWLSRNNCLAIPPALWYL